MRFLNFSKTARGRGPNARISQRGDDRGGFRVGGNRDQHFGIVGIDGHWCSPVSVSSAGTLEHVLNCWRVSLSPDLVRGQGRGAILAFRYDVCVCQISYQINSIDDHVSRRIARMPPPPRRR